MVRIRGFTLVELLVVISIIGILASIVAVNANAARRLSRDSKRKADIQNVAGALELYRATNHIYPNLNPSAGSNLVAVSSYSSQVNSPFRNALSMYTSDIPSDPSGGPSSDGNFGAGYFYVADSSGAHYLLDVALENANEPLTILGSEPGHTGLPADFVTGTYVDSSGKKHYRVSGP